MTGTNYLYIWQHSLTATHYVFPASFQSSNQNKYSSLAAFYYDLNSFHGSWNPEVQWPIHKGSPIIPILHRIGPIHRIGRPTCFSNMCIRLNIVLPSAPTLSRDVFPVGLPVNILKALLPSSIRLLVLPISILITLTILGERYKL